MAQPNPRQALSNIRQSMATLSEEFADGKLNAMQFNAIYRHYAQKRKVIEKLLERDPESDAWQNVARSGQTMELRERFEARVLSFAAFRRNEKKPLRSIGKLPHHVAMQVYEVLKVLWQLETWRTGLARKSLGQGYWLLLLSGEISYTLLIYQMQPSVVQVREARDAHADFERANYRAITRNEASDWMVFPQRALLDN